MISRDPTMRFSQSSVVKACRTPEGPASMQVEARDGRARVTTYGPGRQWLLQEAPDLLGLNDRPEAFQPTHPLVKTLHRRFAGGRMAREPSIFAVLFRVILQQRVKSRDAGYAYRSLVDTYGEVAPGPLGLRLPPSAEVLAGLPYYVLNPHRVEKQRADILRRVARHGPKIERLWTQPAADAGAFLRKIRGIGPWTESLVRAYAFADADAAIVGDYHLPSAVAWALAGEPRADDARMLELLAPFAGHRYRVQKLIGAARIEAPRYGPRMATPLWMKDRG